MALVVKFLGNNSWKYQYKSGLNTPSQLWFSIYDPNAGFGTTYSITLDTTSYAWNPATVTGNVQSSSNGFQTVLAFSTLSAVPAGGGGMVLFSAVSYQSSFSVTNDDSVNSGTDREPVTIVDSFLLKALDRDLADTTLIDAVTHGKQGEDITSN